MSAALAADEVDLLLVSPERLTNPRFRDEQLPRLAEATGLLVVDEAHCISDWGHDFRPDYRRIRDLLTTLPAGRPVLATTATANQRVVDDVVEQLGAGGAPVRTVRGSLARASLRLGVLALPTADARLGWLAARLGELPGSGIVYTLTVAAAEDTAALLREAGHDVRAYTGRTDPADRLDLERALRDNEVKALVATSALGMGFDKPDLGFVVHLGAPASPVAYYQQVGRAGRATERADVLLLPATEDRDIWAYFATASMPRRPDADAVLEALAAADRPMSTAALETVADVRRTRLELLLKVLDVDGAVVAGAAAAGSSTGAGWTYDEERYARVSAARTAEAEAMLGYQRTDRLPDALPAGAARRPGGRRLRALRRLRRALGRPDRPRRARSRPPSGPCAGSGCRSTRGPSGPRGMGRLGRRRCPAGSAPTSGSRRAARWPGSPTSAGGSGCGRCCAAPDGPADDALLGGLRRGARRLGLGRAAGGRRRAALPPAAAARRVGGRPAGRPSGGSPTSARSAWPTTATPASRAATAPSGWPPCTTGSPSRRAMAGALAALDGPVLLVDDLVDSRWTVTVAGRLLRTAGADAVLPFALGLAA